MTQRRTVPALAPRRSNPAAASSTGLQMSTKQLTF